jgi:hypothetical protein
VEQAGRQVVEETDRQWNRQTGSGTGRQAVEQTDRQTDIYPAVDDELRGRFSHIFIIYIESFLKLFSAVGS